jgi:dTDP-4-amino-4,6-dideoxygalactose transaminase
MEVPFLDLKVLYLELKDKFDAAYQRPMESSWYIIRWEIKGFKEEFAAYYDVKYCIGIGDD